jgi:hypothetical protein
MVIISMSLIYQKRFVVLIGTAGVVDLLLSIFSLAWLESSEKKFSNIIVSVVSPILFFFMIIVFIMRWHALRRSRKLVQNDSERYGKLWEAEMQNDQGKDTIPHLESVIKMIGIESDIRCRQYQRRRAVHAHTSASNALIRTATGKINIVSNATASNASTASLPSLEVSSRGKSHYKQLADIVLDMVGMSTEPHTAPAICGTHASNLEPVRSLDQLYACASVVNAVVLEKVQNWAFHSNGLFPLDTVEVNFVRWADVKGTPDENKVKWTSLKKYTVRVRDVCVCVCMFVCMYAVKKE